MPFQEIHLERQYLDFKGFKMPFREIQPKRHFESFQSSEIHQERQ
jgi:hypothetical protein